MSKPAVRPAIARSAASLEPDLYLRLARIKAKEEAQDFRQRYGPVAEVQDWESYSPGDLVEDARELRVALNLRAALQAVERTSKGYRKAKAADLLLAALGENVDLKAIGWSGGLRDQWKDARAVIYRGTRRSYATAVRWAITKRVAESRFSAKSGGRGVLTAPLTALRAKAASILGGMLKSHVHLRIVGTVAEVGGVPTVVYGPDSLLGFCWWQLALTQGLPWPKTCPGCGAMHLRSNSGYCSEACRNRKKSRESYLRSKKGTAKGRDRASKPNVATRAHTR